MWLFFTEDKQLCKIFNNLIIPCYNLESIWYWISVLIVIVSTDQVLKLDYRTLQPKDMNCGVFLISIYFFKLTKTASKEVEAIHGQHVYLLCLTDTRYLGPIQIFGDLNIWYFNISADIFCFFRHKKQKQSCFVYFFIYSFMFCRLCLDQQVGANTEFCRVPSGGQTIEYEHS